jgi:hypothetical protein
MPGLFQKVDTGLKEKGAKKLFGALGAGDGKSERAVIRRSVKGESEERAALALGGKEIGDQQEACILAGEVEEVARGEFFSSDHGRSKFGEKGGLAHTQLGVGETTSDGNIWFR